MTERQHFAAALAKGAASLVTQLLTRQFGPGVLQPIIGPYSWCDFGVLIFIALGLFAANAVVALIIHRRRRGLGAAPSEFRQDLLTAIHKPIHFLIWICGLYVVTENLLLKLLSTGDLPDVLAGLDNVFDFGCFAILLWLFIRLTHVFEAPLAAWSRKSASKADQLLVPLIVPSLRVIVPVIGIIFALPLLGLPPQYAGVVSKGGSILLICAIAWTLLQAVHIGERTLMEGYDIGAADNLHARKIFTQIHFLSRCCDVFIALFAVASILMLFEEVRRLGTSMLASAGVLGIVAGLAAQHTIANLMAGLQLALSQPMRIDDVLIIEGEWGRVEEITMTYVVLKIWDERRMVIPLSYFISNPFQNWTRVSATLLGSVILWTDFTLPVAQVRQAVGKMVEASALWDRRFWNLQVSDTTETAMQLRVLATAADSSKAWDLRCEIREKLIEYLQTHHRESLTRRRLDLNGSQERTVQHRNTPARARDTYLA